MNYYRRFPGDYLRDTMHLSAAEDGMYSRLLDLAYTTEKPLPLDRRLIYRLTRCRNASDKRAIDRVIDEFFKRTRWGYIQKRVQEEINRAESRINAAQKNGASGGRPEKAKTKEKPNGLSKQNPGKSSPDSRLQTPDSQDHKSYKSSSNGLDDLKKSFLSKCQDDSRGTVAAAVEIICDRAAKSGVKIQTEAYIAKAIDSFNFHEGQDKEELQQFFRGGVH